MRTSKATEGGGAIKLRKSLGGSSETRQRGEEIQRPEFQARVSSPKSAKFILFESCWGIFNLLRVPAADPSPRAIEIGNFQSFLCSL